MGIPRILETPIFTLDTTSGQLRENGYEVVSREQRWCLYPYFSEFRPKESNNVKKYHCISLDIHLLFSVKPRASQ